MARRSARVIIPEFTESGRPFWYCRLDAIDRATHDLDRRDATREMLRAMSEDGVRQSYRVDQLIEEAINSALIEGAKLTTRAQAKQIILDGTSPKSHGEKMVVNNYSAMVRLLELNEQELTLDDLMEIHAILGDGSLDAENCAGRLRTADENVRIEDASGDVWFQPPPANELPQRLLALIKFANDRETKPFIHPLVRAIVLHFWLAYLHPFVDGNGRMARALFYWQMLRGGYDFAQYLSISGPIDRSRRAYYMAFAHTETDDGDLTYFVLNQLAVLRRATDDLVGHLKQRSESLNHLLSALSNTRELNNRQQSVLTFLARQPVQSVTVTGHATSHRVTYLTARKDLQMLEKKGLVARTKQGKTDRYFPTESFIARFMRNPRP
ncbi:MAG: Fic family protein [Deltaproteobacteria bacterium]|nr:Fic family protein [Deltaproteobacteria bacterium]